MLYLDLPQRFINISAIIIDAGSISGQEKILNFVKEVLENKNIRDEYWTNGYTAKVIDKEGKKMIKVFFRLDDGYEPSYISPEEFKRILEIWIKERKEFEKDSEAYKEKLKRTGGIVEEFTNTCIR